MSDDEEVEKPAWQARIDKKLDDLYPKVTLAIMRAEAHDYEGSKLWDEVARCELAIADHLKKLHDKRVEYKIAKRGVRSAKARAKFLRGGEGGDDGDARASDST